MKMVNEIKSTSSDAKMMSCSSIAMLQERFRQLEKMKEMREERELLKLISSSSSSNNHQQSSPAALVTSSNNLYHDDPSSHMFFHSEIIFPTRLCRLPSAFDSQLLSLSLWPNTKHDDYSYWDIDITHDHHHKSTTKLPSWLSDVVPIAPTSSVVIKNETTSHLTCEVDTTLHL